MVKGVAIGGKAGFINLGEGEVEEVLHSWHLRIDGGKGTYHDC